MGTASAVAVNYVQTEEASFFKMRPGSSIVADWRSEAVSGSKVIQQTAPLLPRPPELHRR